MKVEGLDEAIAKFSSLEIATALNSGIKKSIFAVDRQAKRETPVDVGRLRSAWRQRFGRLTGRLVNTSLYAPYVHEGRRPGGKAPPSWPNSPLAKWVARKGINAPVYVIARSIAKKGTKANPFLKRAVDAQRDKIPAILRGEISSLLRK